MTVLIVRIHILDVLVATLASLTLPWQKISVKTLTDLTGSATDLLQTDTERVRGLKNSHKTNPWCDLFLRKPVRSVPSQSAGDPWKIHGSSVNLLHDHPHPLCIPISYYIWNCGVYSWPLRLCVTGPLKNTARFKLTITLLFSTYT